jgi:hypothetical protein
MKTVIYKGKKYEIVESRKFGTIMRLVENNGYWLPIKNSLEDRLKGLKITESN